MAKNALNVNFYPNTLKDNDAILRKLRSRSKIDNKTQEEWSKLFTKLNTESKKQTNKTSDLRQVHIGNSEDVTYGVIEGFPSGSWWGIRMDCARDRVHKSFDNDIDEGVFGVASICTSHVNTTNDVDLGTYLTFTGGKYNQSKPTDPLLTNFNNHIPLRLIRSYNLANEFAPKTGYRYDGLYIVASCWIGINSKDSTRYYKYALARLNHQEAPPWVTQTRIVTRQSSSQKSPLKSCGLYKCHMYGCSQESKKFKSCESEVEKVKLNADLGEKEKEASLLNSLNFISKPYKLQNTNISIRTELYDSSPNPQQDIKKTPMTYCRVYNKTKSESKKLDVELKKVQQEDKITECKNLFLDSRASTRASVGSESSGLSEKKVDLQKAVVEIETMTPEQMLNLIIKKRYNPTGKLLIGSIIGLPENEGKNLNAGKVKDREGKSKMNHFRETRSTVKNQEVKVNRSKSKKSVPRKRKNELANLTIDANFGMNLRGQCIQTRTMKNRRLRCPAIILSKRKDLSDYITSYPRVELRRKGKIIATAKKSQINGCKRLSVGNKNKDEGKHEIRGNLKDRNNCNNILKRRNKIINTESSLIKPRMVDASTQCIATKDATTFVNMETQKKNEKSLIKIEVIDLEDEEEMEEVKSEFEDSNSEEEEEEEESLRQKKFYSGNDVNINNDNDDNDNLSAFVALSDRDMRVARLRSIGFKPIEPVIVSENGSFVQYYNCDASTSSLHAVTERQVDEQYNKYTSEENNVVEYMDHELHFQDIEEDGIKHDYKISGGNFDVNKGDYKSGKKRRCSSSEEEFQDDESKNFDEQEAPWLGWSRSTANR